MATSSGLIISKKGFWMIDSRNEWSNLKRIIVGSASNAHWPVKCPVFRRQEKTTKWSLTPVPKGPVSQNIIDEANEDLEQLSDTLKGLGVLVERPKNLDFQSFDGMYNYCPRDRLLILGSKVIDVPMLYPSRQKEIEALSEIIETETISCDEKGVILDAANVCRLNNDLLYLVSESGNLKGARWLKSVLGNEYRIHILDNIYNGVHIDSTITPVREGLVVVNGDRINGNNLPEIFNDWEVISIQKSEIVEQNFIDYPYASNYIALNFLVISPELVICDPKQAILRRKLKEKGIYSIGINLRHSRTLGGGHHCVTLDLLRENYGIS